MEAKITQKEVRSVELTEEQFNDLTADMVPVSIEELRQVAVDILTSDNGRSEDLIKVTERCRRFLNTQHTIRRIMIAFKPDH